MDANEQKARELLAAEYERDEFDIVQARQIREGYVTNTTATALRAIMAALAQQVPADGEWVPSGADYDRSIHSNPDAKAWADFFVATFPGQADKHDLMLGWFANAMMAMHDHLKQSATPQAPQPVVDEWQYRPCRTLTGESIPVEQRGSWSRDTHDAHKTPSEAPAWEFRALYAASQPQQGAVDSVLHPVYSPENFRFSTTIGQPALDETP